MPRELGTQGSWQDLGRAVGLPGPRQGPGAPACGRKNTTECSKITRDVFFFVRCGYPQAGGAGSSGGGAMSPLLRYLSSPCIKEVGWVRAGPAHGGSREEESYEQARVPAKVALPNVGRRILSHSMNSHESAGEERTGGFEGRVGRAEHLLGRVRSAGSIAIARARSSFPAVFARKRNYLGKSLTDCPRSRLVLHSLRARL